MRGLLLALPCPVDTHHFWSCWLVFSSNPPLHYRALGPRKDTLLWLKSASPLWYLQMPFLGTWFCNYHSPLTCIISYLGLISVKLDQSSQPWHHWHFGLDKSLLWGCPMHYWMFSSNPGLYVVGSASPSFSYDKKNISRHCQISPGRQNYPRARTTVQV